MLSACRRVRTSAPCSQTPIRTVNAHLGKSRPLPIASAAAHIMHASRTTHARPRLESLSLPTGWCQSVATPTRSRAPRAAMRNRARRAWRPQAVSAALRQLAAAESIPFSAEKKANPHPVPILFEVEVTRRLLGVDAWRWRPHPPPQILHWICRASRMGSTLTMSLWPGRPLLSVAAARAGSLTLRVVTSAWSTCARVIATRLRPGSGASTWHVRRSRLTRIHPQ